MPDTRKHRGPHPADTELFRPQMIPKLCEAVNDFSWLLTHRYSDAAALKLVGDRYHLTERQRKAVMRSSCSDQALIDRQKSRLSVEQLSRQQLCIDGFNLLTTVEAALAGGVVLHARDGCFRDLAGMHGNYRKVDETRPALLLIGNVLAEFEVLKCLWYLDKPVSNSGRLSGIIREISDENNWNWKAELVDNPDPILISTKSIVVSADSGILDLCGCWVNLAREVVERKIPAANVIRLSVVD